MAGKKKQQDVTPPKGGGKRGALKAAAAARRKGRYQAQPGITERNKRRALRRQARLYPEDRQAVALYEARYGAAGDLGVRARAARRVASGTRARMHEARRRARELALERQGGAA